MDTLLIAIIMLGLPSLVAHIMTLHLLYDCRKHGHQFGEEARHNLTNFEQFQDEMVKIGSDIADTLEIAFDKATVTTVAGTEEPISLTNLDPKEMLMRTIATVITDKLNGAVHGGTQSEEWQVHQSEKDEQTDFIDGTSETQDEQQSD